MGRNSDCWYKRYPRDYIEGTRHLSPDARFVYSESIDHLRRDERPLPDDIGWLACAFHAPRRKIKVGLAELIANGKIVRTPEGLINPKCMEDIAARQHQREINTKTAREREENRRDLGQNPAANESTEAKNPSVANDSGANSCNETGATRAGDQNHHQIPDPEEELICSSSARTAASAANSEGSNSKPERIDDDDHVGGVSPTRPERSIPARIVRELELQVGPEDARELVGEYLSSSYPDGATGPLGRAFVGWLKKTYGIQISGRGSTYGFSQLAEMCPVDERGRPNTRTATADELRARSQRLAERQVSAGGQPA